MADAGPYGITQFDAAGVINNYQAAQSNRMRMMLEQKQLEQLDAQSKRTAATATAWAKVVGAGQSGASKATDAYGTTPSSASPTPSPASVSATPADPLAPLPDAAAAPASPTAPPSSAAPVGALDQINQQAVPALLSALGPEQGIQFLEHWQTLDKNKQEAVAAHNKEIGQAIAWADTPQKWDQAVDVLSKQNPQLAQYKGHFDQRGQAAMQIGAISSFVEASKPDLMDVGPGHSVIDKTHPELGPSYTAPAEIKQFSVHNADGTDTPYGFDSTTGRTFQLHDAGGPVTGGAATAAVGGAHDPDTLFNALIQQESGGHAGVTGPLTKYGRSTGLTQLLPDTAKAMAAKVGVPWQPELLTGTTPEAADYQRKLGRAYFDEGMQKYPNDPRDALMYYHGGPDQAQWGPKTHAYADAILKRVGGSASGSSGDGTPITGKGGGPLSDDAAKLAAAIYKTKGSLPTGIARTKGDVDKIMNVAAHMSLDEAHQVADQTVGTWQNTKSAQDTLTAFSKGKQGDTTRSLNVAIQHIDLLRSAATALQNGNIPMFNSISQHIAQATGHVAPSNFDGLKQLVSDEVVKGVVGTAAGVGDRADAGRTVGRAGSPQQLIGIFDNWQNLMAGQAQGLQKQYEAGTGRKDYADKYLLPRTRQLLLKSEGQGGWTTLPSGLKIRKVQ